MSERHELPASESPRASVLIAAFNPSTFGECLRSLAAHLPEAPSCEVIATLNGPADALLDSAAGVTGLRTVDTPVNLGLAAGANLARSRARGELMVLVQDDAEIESGWLETLVAAADAHPEAGAVGGMVTWPGGERVQTAGLVLWNDCSHSEVGAGSHPDDWAGSDPFAVDYCSSSSLLVRAETWDAVGGLDDSFFPAGHVDADLAMRIRRANRAVLVEPRARSYHRRAASSTKPFKRFIAVRNAELFRERWGAELARTQEPPGERGAVELERALGRAEARRSRCARRATAPTGEPRVAGDIDPLSFSRRELALYRAYVSELEPALEHFESEAGGRRKQVAELNERLRERDEQLAAITQGGWWRLRERLLPLLKLAGAARSRWSRR